MPSVGTTAHDEDINKKLAGMSNFLTELHHLKVPFEFPNMLESFAREVLRHQPADLVQFGMEYFEEQLNKRPGRRGLAGMKKAKQQATKSPVDPAK